MTNHCIFCHFSDVLTYMDHWCSGKKQCEVEINDFVTLTDVCPQEVVGYLRAKFICLRGKAIKSRNMSSLLCYGLYKSLYMHWSVWKMYCDVLVLNGMEQCCRSPGISINVTDHEGYMAAGGTQCGENNCPLLLKARKGQQFNIWAYYFNTSSIGKYLIYTIGSWLYWIVIQIIFRYINL